MAAQLGAPLPNTLPRERDGDLKGKVVETSDYVKGHWEPVHEEVAVEGVRLVKPKRLTVLPFRP